MVVYPVRNNPAGSFAAAESHPEQGGSQYNAFAEPKPILEGDDLKGFLSRMERIVAYYNGIESYRGV